MSLAAKKFENSCFKEPPLRPACQKWIKSNIPLNIYQHSQWKAIKGQFLSLISTHQLYIGENKGRLADDFFESSSALWKLMEWMFCFVNNYYIINYFEYKVISPPSSSEALMIFCFFLCNLYYVKYIQWGQFYI